MTIRRRVHQSPCHRGRSYRRDRSAWNELTSWLSSLKTWLNSLLPAIFGLAGTLIDACISYQGQSKAQKPQFEEARKERVWSEIITLAASAEKWMQEVSVPYLFFQGATIDEVAQMLSDNIGNELRKATEGVENSLNYLLFYVKDKELHKNLLVSTYCGTSDLKTHLVFLQTTPSIEKTPSRQHLSL